MGAPSIDPAPRPDTGAYEVVRRAGEPAVVVPMSDFLRWRALEDLVSDGVLADAEDAAALAQWRARDAAHRAVYVPLPQARRRLGLDG